jgi:DNA-binding response OmpR family regulator
MLETTSAILLEEGHQVIRWSEGKTAYDFVRRHQPDLLIVDVRMEHPQAGQLIIHMLRLNPQTASLPVLVCTGDLEYVRTHAQMLRAQHCEVLLKPFSVDDLLNKVNQLLSNPHTVAEAENVPTADVQVERAARWKRIAQRVKHLALHRFRVFKRR